MSLEASDGLCGLVSPGASVGASLAASELDGCAERVLVHIEASGNEQVIDLRDGNLRAIVEILSMNDGRWHVARRDASLADAWRPSLREDLRALLLTFMCFEKVWLIWLSVVRCLHLNYKNGLG